jgi:hypothetical protein
LAPARTRLARKQNAGLLLGSPSFADPVRGPKGKGSNGADTASRTCLPAGRAPASQKWKIIYLQVLRVQDHPSISSGQAGPPTIIWFIFVDFSQSLYYVKVFVGHVLSSLKSMPLIKQK